MLTNYDLEMDLTSPHLQPGLNFGERKKELFAGKEMGEDALRVLDLYVTARDRILTDIAAELPNISTAEKFANSLLRPHSRMKHQ